MKIDFQDGGHGGHLGLPIGTILAVFFCLFFFFFLFFFFLSTSHPDISYHVSSPLAFRFRRKNNQVTPKLPTRFESAGLSVQAKN